MLILVFLYSPCIATLKITAQFPFYSNISNTKKCNSWDTFENDNTCIKIFFQFDNGIKQFTLQFGYFRCTCNFFEVIPSPTWSYLSVCCGCVWSLVAGCLHRLLPEVGDPIPELLHSPPWLVHKALPEDSWMWQLKYQLELNWYPTFLQCHLKKSARVVSSPTRVFLAGIGQ